MKVFNVSFRDSDGRLQYGVYIVAPDIETALRLIPGKAEGIQESGPCIAIHQEIEINPFKSVKGAFALLGVKR